MKENGTFMNQKKMKYVHTMEYDVAGKKNNRSPFELTGQNLR